MIKLYLILFECERAKKKFEKGKIFSGKRARET